MTRLPHWLHSAGYRYSWTRKSVAPSPDAAWIDCLKEEVDLLIIDPNPQSRAATSLVKALRAYRPHVPVLVLTAYDTPRLRAQMQTLGVQHYLAKPIDLLDLNEVVRTALETATHADMMVPLNR